MSLARMLLLELDCIFFIKLCGSSFCTMSTQSEEEPTSEPMEEEKPVGKIYYCEICEVPCMSSMTLQTHFAGLRHKKRERALKAPRDPVIYEEEPEPAKKLLPINIKSLKEFVKDPDRGEPLVGLEYVIEIRFKGRKEPSYECQLCEFSTEMVPMIEHLTGQRHRKLYLRKHHPDKVKRIPNEDKAIYLRRAARHIEKEEGLKNYKCESFERYCIPSATAKRKGKVLHKPKNNFEITSDAEATLVVNLAQYLSEALKAFCEKRATIVRMRSLPPLMKKGRNNSNQASQCEPTNQASQCESTNQASQCEFTNQASKYEPTKPFENYQRGDTNQDQGDTNWDLGNKNWNLGQLSNGVAQLKSLLQQTSSISHTPTESYGSQMCRRVPSSVISSKDQATMSALQSSFALQPGGIGCGIEWMKQFNQSASAYGPSTSAGARAPNFTSPQGGYPTQHHQGSSNNRMPDSGIRPWSSMRDSLGNSNNRMPDSGIRPWSGMRDSLGNSNNRMPDSGIRPWSGMRDSLDSKAYPLTPVSYPVPRGYQANYPSQRFPSWYGGGSRSGNDMPASFSSERNSTGWPQQSGYQQSNFRGDGGSYSSFSGNRSCHNYQQQNTQLNNLISGSNSGLTADIMNQLRGKDTATLTSMLQQLVPHYPDLQSKCIILSAQILFPLQQRKLNIV
ncbi:hypothetical protein lerEdw1_001891 [Lerista edwardsae]|nr:hypothetical protein lerEdw1_001891 [Lerista edwardsae]